MNLEDNNHAQATTAESEDITGVSARTHDLLNEGEQQQQQQQQYPMPSSEAQEEEEKSTAAIVQKSLFISDDDDEPKEEEALEDVLSSIEPLPSNTPIANAILDDKIRCAVSISSSYGPGAYAQAESPPLVRLEATTTTATTATSEVGGASSGQHLLVAHPVTISQELLELPTAQEVVDLEQARDSSSSRREPRNSKPDSDRNRSRSMLYALLGVVVAVGAVLLLVFLLPSETPTMNAVNTTNVQKEGATAAPTASTRDYVLGLLSADTIVAIRNYPDAPPTLAFHWLIDDDAPFWETLWNSTNTTDADIRETRILQRYGLAIFYFALRGDDWYQNTEWLEPGVDECLWHSSFDTPCHDQDPDRTWLFVDVALDSNNLRGTVPPEVFPLLPNLRVFDVAHNSVTGTIPSELGIATDLLLLNVMDNHITGPLPALPSKLMMVNLAENQLTGTLPAIALGQMTSLFDWNVTDNAFRGPIPSGKVVLFGTALYNLFFVPSLTLALYNTLPQNSAVYPD